MKQISALCSVLALFCCAMFYAPHTSAAACSVTIIGTTSILDNSCSSLTWTSGNLDMNSKSVIGDETAFAVFAPLTGSITLGTMYNVSQITAPNTGIYIYGIAFNPYSANASISVTAINNRGTITAGTGIYSSGDTNISTLNNSGVITGYSYAIKNGTSSIINNLVNTGEIASTEVDSVAISNNGTITSIQNSGTIRGQGKGIGNTSGSITTIVNSGTISATGSAIYLATGVRPGSIGTITNTGSLIGSSSNITNMAGTLGTLNNLQGVGNSNGALTYTGALPTNYNIIINSLTQYGQLVGTNVSGTMTFGISSLTVSSSSIINTNIADVLTGITAEQLGRPGVTSFSANSNGYGYTLTLTNLATNTWGLTLSDCGMCISANRVVTLSDIGISAYPILSGGTLVLYAGEQSSQAFTVTANSTITSPVSGSATLSGIFSGAGGLTFNGSGTTVLTGTNTYTGGTLVASGTLSVAGNSPTGTSIVTIASGATLMGRGTITGPVNISGTLKPGNSPGYLSTTSSVTMNAGSSFLQDIAGTTQASSTSPVGASGYYSFLNVTNGQFVIQPGATLTPQLSNLFSASQSGYGSAIYAPGLGDRFRVITASGGISGRFSTLTQPEELAAGTQFLPFYNMAGSNSLELAVIPSSYVNTIAAASGNANAQSVGDVLTQTAQNSFAGTATSAQEQLLYSISRLTNAQSIVSVAQSLAGEVYAATVAVMAQTTQRTQQAVLARLGDTAGLGHSSTLMNSNSNVGINASNMGGPPTAAVSSNPNVNPNAEAQSLSNGNVWGDLAYQRGNRSSDSQSGGWNSNLYQLTFGSDFYSSNGMTLGGGFALSSTTLNPVYGSATIQQGSLFAYGKMPIDAFVVDAMASIGLSSSDITRGDMTGLSNGFRNKTVSGNDALISLGLSRPIEMDGVRVTPFARVTWQMVTQSGVNEGDVASALTVNRYAGNGVRGVIGVAAGSKANNPMTEKYTYRAYVGLGVESTGLLNPTLNASLAGLGTNMTTPSAGTTFVQAGLYGTAKLAENTFAYAGISGEARSGQTLGTVNVGLRVQF